MATSPTAPTGGLSHDGVEPSISKLTVVERIEHMTPDEFYPRMIDIGALPPQERHLCLADIHTLVLEHYLLAVQNMNEKNAQQAVPMVGDSRTFAQLIGHIAEWDRFALLAAGDILAGIQHPRMIHRFNRLYRTRWAAARFCQHRRIQRLSGKQTYTMELDGYSESRG
jgi:hypothetical protein